MVTHAWGGIVPLEIKYGERNFTTKLGTNCQHFKWIFDVIRDV